MTNMWSNNKLVNNIVNILIFLTALNFLHYGQLILPIICLILFIENKFRFKVNNIKIFIILCLFSVSFFIFTGNLGFYRVMGFCFPMAYYIGSNLKENSDENIRKLIYIIAFGMMVHTILNFVYDLSLFGMHTFSKNTHYDFWTRQAIATTTTASNSVILTGCLFYLLVYEKNNVYKLSLFGSYAIFLIYNIGLGRRTPILLAIVSLFVALVYYVFTSKNKQKILKIILKGLTIALICVLVLVLLFVFNVLGFKNFVTSLKIYNKFLEYGLDLGRIDIIINTIKLAPTHLWGGGQISSIMGISVHDLWLDTFDLSGIVSFALIILWSVLTLIDTCKYIKKNNSKNNSLYIPLLVCVIIELMLEPIMSSLTIFFICITMISSSLERK